MVTKTIGENSKAEHDKFNKARSAHESSEAYKKAKEQAKKLDRLYDSGKIDGNKYEIEYEKLRKSVYKPELDNSVTITSKGRKYSEAYIKTYGRSLNMAYIKDLGYYEEDMGRK